MTPSLLILSALLALTQATPEAEPQPQPQPDASPALVAHHGTPYSPVPHHPPHHAHHPTTPYPPPYGLSSPVYVHSSPMYGPTTPAYGHSTPVYEGYPAPPHHPSRPIGKPLKHYAPHPHQKHYTPHPPKDHYAPEHPAKCGYEKPPSCSHNSSKSWCLDDHEYPTYELSAALEYHKKAALALYADVADLNTANSVVRPSTLDEESYLCPSVTRYVRPLRAINTHGRWRVIVNNVKLDYEQFTQTTRLEECLKYGQPCGLVPHCYQSSCLQKSIYHRFMVYDECDKHFPFAIETFKLPASCSCHMGAYYITH